MLKLRVIKGNSYLDTLKKLVHDKNLIIKKNSNGKPIILNSKYYFSVTHSGNYTLLVVADKPIGIDMELIRDYDHRLLKILNLKSMSTYDFFKEWTRREAIIKRNDLKLGDILNLDVTGFKF